MKNNNQERAHVYVSGDVQGVFYRDSTRQKARQLGLSGWVKNLPDGRVEALFEGPSEKIREMVRWCEQGPPHAAVENVDVEFDSARQDFSRFEVR